MYSVNIRGYDITCESTQEVLELVGAAAIPEPKQTRVTPPRATKGRKTPTAAEKRKRNEKARASYSKKKAAQERYLTKKAAEDEVTTTAETHHGSPTPAAAAPKQQRADTGGEVIAALRRSGLALTIPEIHEDLQKAGWKYDGDNPLNTIRSTLNRLGAKGTVARGQNAGDGGITFMIARVEHDDPLPHQQRETDV